jgi:hypothetical protein
LWPGLDPLGQTLDLAAIPEGRSGRRLHDRVRVIGVTEDVATGTILDGSIHLRLFSDGHAGPRGRDDARQGPYRRRRRAAVGVRPP